MAAPAGSRSSRPRRGGGPGIGLRDLRRVREERDDEPGRLVVAVPGRDVLHTGIAPLLLDHPPDTVEIVVVLGIARIQRNRLPFDPGPAFARATGTGGPTATECGATIDQ